MRADYPQCSKQYNSQKLIDKHISGGEQQCHDALSNAMRHVDKLLAQKNLPVSGAIDRASYIGTGAEVTFATIEPHFHYGWAYVTRAHKASSMSAGKLVSAKSKVKQYLYMYIPAFKRW